MGNFLKVFHSHEEYEQFRSGSGYVSPNISVCEDDDFVHYETSSHKFNRHCKTLFKTNIGDTNYGDEVDYEEFFIYDGEYYIDGNKYYKWKKHLAPNAITYEASFLEDNDVYVLTEKRDYFDASISNPCEIAGMVYNDFAQIAYTKGDFIVEASLNEPEYII